MSYQSYPNLPPQIPKRWFTYIILVFCGFGAIVNLISLLITGIVIAAIQGYIFYLINSRKLRGHKIYFVINGVSMLLFALSGYFAEVGILAVLMYIIYLDYSYVNKQLAGPQFGFGPNQPSAFSNENYQPVNTSYNPTINVNLNNQNQPHTSTSGEGGKAGIPLNFCGNCGKKVLESDTQFCQNCGAPIKK